MAKEKKYIAIDLKSFYASVECIERGLDPINTNLVVADESRTNKTICLAVSPSLKKYGIPGRARLFEVEQKVREVNGKRRMENGYKGFTGESYNAKELEDKNIKLSFIAAVPRMNLYKAYSTKIYDIYLRFVSPEDIHVYSIDEVFIDVTNYLKNYDMDAVKMAKAMINTVLKETGIIATAGVGTNMYLCKIAMDIVAKKVPSDENGVRIAEIDEMSYRRLLWEHRPLTDFWRIGRGYSKKLESVGLYTMGDIARCSLGASDDFYNEALLYKLFGINAELLIDHAWGWEPCTIDEIKSYVPENNSLSSGQVLTCPYPWDKARIIVREMIDLMALDLVEKGLVTDQIVLTLIYDVENVTKDYEGEIIIDHYGRLAPKHAHGTANLGRLTASTKLMTEATIALFDRISDKSLTVRKVNISLNHIIYEKDIVEPVEQLDLFTDYSKREEEERLLKRERNLQKALINIQRRYGKNAILKGTNYQEGATTRERNNQVGGHRA